MKWSCGRNSTLGRVFSYNLGHRSERRSHPQGTELQGSQGVLETYSQHYREATINELHHSIIINAGNKDSCPLVTRTVLTPR